MEGDDSGEGSAVAGDFEDAGAAEAVTDGGDVLLFKRGDFFELGESGVEALAVEFAIAFVFAGFFA
jgi:hypothetical protein